MTRVKSSSKLKVFNIDFPLGKSQTLSDSLPILEKNDSDFWSWWCQFSIPVDACQLTIAPLVSQVPALQTEGMGCGWRGWNQLPLGDRLKRETGTARSSPPSHAASCFLALSLESKPHWRRSKRGTVFGE